MHLLHLSLSKTNLLRDYRLADTDLHRHYFIFIFVILSLMETHDSHRTWHHTATGRHYAWKDSFTLVNDGHVTFYDQYDACYKKLHKVRLSIFDSNYLETFHIKTESPQRCQFLRHILWKWILCLLFLCKDISEPQEQVLWVFKSHHEKAWNCMKKHETVWKSIEEHAWEMKTHFVCVVALFVCILSLESLAISTVLFLTTSTSTSTPSSLFPSTPTPSYAIPSTSTNTRYGNKH